ncbi:MAG: hypothetical protein IPO83_09920 [Chitinophagaceae bacterium]|nr:hypothetical protein [Chitinophagaceae bacterium]
MISETKQKIILDRLASLNPISVAVLVLLRGDQRDDSDLDILVDTQPIIVYLILLTLNSNYTAFGYQSRPGNQKDHCLLTSSRISRKILFISMLQAKPELTYLKHILDCCVSIEEYTQSMNEENFLRDKKLRML